MNNLVRMVFNNFIRVLVCLFVAEAAFAVGIQQEVPASSIWVELGAGKAMTATQKRTLFVTDCGTLSTVNAVISHHEKNNATLRIVTYNVHNWLDSLFKHNYDGIMHVIATIKADVLVLQEAGLFDTKKVYSDLQGMGYAHIVFCPIKEGTKGQVGNLIASKYPFTKAPRKQCYGVDKNRKQEEGTKKPETMNFINAELALPGGKTVSVYDVYLMYGLKPEDHRAKELEELLQAMEADACPNKIILGDFNAVRARDYAYQVNGKTVWDLLQANDASRGGIKTPTHALQLLETKGWQDSFAKAGVQGPRFTVWPGKVVDYIWVTPTWQLPIVGSYVYYDAASDHLPIIADIQMRLITPTMVFLDNDNLKQRVKQLWGHEIALYSESVIKPLMLNEVKYHDTHYCFYHAQQPIFQLIHDLSRELWEALGNGSVPDDYTFLRFWRNDVGAQTVNEFIDAHERGNHETRWYNRQMAEKILSVNLALFGNLNHDGECSFHYFLKNFSVNQNFYDQGLHDTKQIAHHLVKNVLAQLDLQNIYAQPLCDLTDLLQSKTGNLFQILVPKEKVDDWVYVCHGSGHYGYGTPYRVNDLSRDPIVQAAYNPYKKRFTKISPILDAYRRNPESIEHIDKIQARLVFVPEVLNPQSGIKIIRFSSIEPQALQEYTKKLKELVAQMLSEKQSYK